MKQGDKTTVCANALVYRDGDSIEVEALISWLYDSGVFVEQGHRHNGHGRGWYVGKMEAWDVFGNEVELSEHEIERISQENQPDEEAA